MSEAAAEVLEQLAEGAPQLEAPAPLETPAAGLSRRGVALIVVVAIVALLALWYFTRETPAEDPK